MLFMHRKKVGTLHTKLFTVSHFCNVFGFYSELELLLWLKRATKNILKYDSIGLYWFICSQTGS